MCLAKKEVIYKSLSDFSLKERNGLNRYKQKVIKKNEDLKEYG